MFRDTSAVAAAALKTVKDVYDQHLIISTDFKNLKDSTTEALVEFKRLNERLIDQLANVERERVRSEAELLARVAMLEARLAAITEQAMISAVRERSGEIAREVLRNEQLKLPGKEDSEPNI